jgi:hypothetical protein
MAANGCNNQFIKNGGNENGNNNKKNENINTAKTADLDEDLRKKVESLQVFICRIYQFK